MTKKTSKFVHYSWAPCFEFKFGVDSLFHNVENESRIRNVSPNSEPKAESGT